MATNLDTDQGQEASPSTGKVMTPERLAAIATAAKRLRENPLFEEYLASIEEYRRENNTVPEPE